VKCPIDEVSLVTISIHKWLGGIQEERKMKNVVLKTCLTTLVLSMSGLAAADLAEHSAVAGASLSIAAQPAGSIASNFDGNVAAQAAVSIGAYSIGGNVYAGAAVTTGAWSQVGKLQAGAGVGVGANATADAVVAGAAVVTGALANVKRVNAGAAITLGAGTYFDEVIAGAAITYGAGALDDSADNYKDDNGVYQPQLGHFSVDDMNSLKDAINEKLDTNQSVVGLQYPKEMSGQTLGCDVPDNKYHFAAMNVAANSVLTFDGGSTGCNITVLSSEAVTMGAQSKVELINGASVTWILAGELNVGENAVFQGQAYVKGSITAATADVCGNLYATGAISVRSIGLVCP
jgi:hypothetical protein